MAKIRVINYFRDKVTGEVRNPGDIIEIKDKGRVSKIVKMKLGVEIEQEQKQKDPNKEPEKAAGEKPADAPAETDEAKVE